jgi:hypothetical protein
MPNNFLGLMVNFRILKACFSALLNFIKKV